MYCEKCGNKLNDNVRFCDRCGNSIQFKSNNEELNEVKTVKGIESKNISQQYNFSKCKQIGTITMFIVNTKANINENKLLLNQQKKYLGFIGGKEKVMTIALNEIASVTTKKSVDLIDGIYAIIFALLGFVSLNPICFLIMAVCLWTGYGERIIIETKNNIKIKIHARSGKETSVFMNDIKSYIR
ncbi:zinc-ribbon domain-containing protein [Clostridium saccharobutylicum]|uniref:Zinc-ribbon domain-containing protein n=1 Tax=Clostridium saccharobutylicum TaxID=169679 RepID=A0A1S8N4C4_CLOSA|nr:zinc ribbon domain-containing protein [Clostridium saccharobutylicum]OOM11151.1 hypothetical protein CLOSAC_26940 [Clostridium saccharobutylicum]